MIDTIEDHATLDASRNGPWSTFGEWFRVAACVPMPFSDLFETLAPVSSFWPGFFI